MSHENKINRLFYRVATDLIRIYSIGWLKKITVVQIIRKSCVKKSHLFPAMFLAVDPGPDLDPEPGTTSRCEGVEVSCDFTPGHLVAISSLFSGLLWRLLEATCPPSSPSCGLWLRHLGAVWGTPSPFAPQTLFFFGRLLLECLRVSFERFIFLDPVSVFLLDTDGCG